MAEFIGARISLVSRSDIRYVGTLHEINSETSTVALENVSSFGTEGRKNNPGDEIAPSDSVYDYIVFRGSDVKDLRIEEAPAAKENKPPQVPNDPAILGSGSRPTPQAQAPQRPQQAQAQQQQGPPQVQGPQQQGPPHGPPHFGQHPQYPPFYPPPPAGWGRGGPPGPVGFPVMPYGAPPGWYPPPGQGFPPGPPGTFSPYGYPPGPPGQFQQPGQHQSQPSKPIPIGPGAIKQASPSSSLAEKQLEPKSLSNPTEMPAASVRKPSTPPAAKTPASEPKVAPTHPSAALNSAIPVTIVSTKVTPTGPKNNTRIPPAIPTIAPAKAPLQSNSGSVPPPSAAIRSDAVASLRDATQAATAAVAAAMAKLPPQNGANGNAMDNLTRKVNEMRTDEAIRAPRQPGVAGFTGGRGARGGGRGGARNPAQKVEVPRTDFDFESANAKFNKQDLVKEAIAGSPIGESPVSPTEPDVPVAGYNKATSFFDNISSESKDRMEAGNTRTGGREWRGEEQKKNVETFGQGSVDNGYRGGFRGRGRGRGFRGRGYSGNGQPGRGRGGYRGRGDEQTIAQ